MRLPELGPTARRYGQPLVATLFSVSGVVHLVRPSVFAPLVPAWLPSPTGVVVVSGLAELVCAAGLWSRQRWAGRASAALLLVVWVGNVQMALDASGTAAVVAWVRVPLQVPLVWAALQERP